MLFPLRFRPILHHCAEITVTGVSEESHPLHLNSEERKLRVPGVDTKDFDEDFGDGQDFYTGIEGKTAEAFFWLTFFSLKVEAVDLNQQPQVI